MSLTGKPNPGERFVIPLPDVEVLDKLVISAMLYHETLYDLVIQREDALIRTLPLTEGTIAFIKGIKADNVYDFCRIIEEHKSDKPVL